MPPQPASHAYYRAKHGVWRGELRLVVTDAAALRVVSPRLFDRLRARATAALFNAVGSLRLDTTLDYQTSGAQGRVVHTTRVSWRGIPLLRGVEQITLHPDGVTATMDRREWAFPWPIPDVDRGARVVVAPAGDAAAYDLTWFGAPLRQITHTVDIDRLRLVQLTSWSRAEVVLERHPRTC